MKVSVVMISYNVARYIGQALESVINQTLKDIEIIVVDKFSNDGTREIIKDYMGKDNRIKLIDDIKGSAGYSYNAGIREARGEYIGFVETDDYVESDMYERLYNLARKHNLDYVKGNFYFFVTDAKRKELSRKHDILDQSWGGFYGKVIKSNDYPELILFDAQLWAGIFRREYLVDNNVMLNESKGAAFQDHGFQWQALAFADKCMYIQDAFYHYRKDNLAASMNNPKALFMDLKELKYIKRRLSIIKNLDNGYWRVFYTKILYILHYRLHQYFSDGGQITEELKNCINDYRSILEEGRGDGLYDENTLDYDIYYEWLKMRYSIDGYLNHMMDLSNGVIEREKTLLAFVASAKEIVIFGNGYNGKDLYWFLCRKGYGDKIVAFCDNDHAKRATSDEVEVLAVNEATEKYPKACYMVANYKWVSVMRKQLIDLGIHSSRIHLYKWVLPEWRTI